MRKNLASIPTAFPRNLSLSLGSGEITPLEIVSAYAVFSNGGYQVKPHIIDHITDKAGNTVFDSNPPAVCPECETQQVSKLLPTDAQSQNAGSSTTRDGPAVRTIDADNAWMISSILRDVITSGTGRRALVLKRKDLGGENRYH